MTCGCGGGQNLDSGDIPGGASMPEIDVLFAMTSDTTGVDAAGGVVPVTIATTIFPATTTLLSLPLAAGLLARDGDRIRAQFTGLGINATGAGVQWFPFLQMSGVAWYGGTTAVTPVGDYSFDYDVTIQRRGAGLTYSAGGRIHLNNDLAPPIVGVGALLTPAPGSPIGRVVADGALNWGLAQTFEMLVTSNAAGPGGQWRLKTGTIELVHAPG